MSEFSLYGAKSLLDPEVLFLATCWKIERNDNQSFLFTDHNEDLVLNFPDTEIYHPTNGLTASARQKASGLRDQNTELLGIISDDDITEEDLRAGRFREARVTEHLVDWRAPWAGSIMMNKYFIESVSWTGERWEAQVVGISSWLNRPIGELYTRNCRYRLGDSRCGIDLDDYKYSGTVTHVLEDYSSFKDTGLPTSRLLPLPIILVYLDNYYRYGNIYWKTGDNAKINSEISFSRSSGQEFDLQLKTPFPIQVGDTFDVTPGCNKLSNLLNGDCTLKYLNTLNFGGFPTIPGSDKTLQTPAPKGDSPLSKLGLDYFKK